MAWLATLILWAALGLAACGTSTTNSTSSTDNGTVGDVGLVSSYCLYRSDTKAQMLACEARTDPALVRSRDDAAARWARGELQTCGKGAGELCRKLYRAILEGQVGREPR